METLSPVADAAYKVAGDLATSYSMRRVAVNLGHYLLQATDGRDPVDVAAELDLLADLVKQARAVTKAVLDWTVAETDTPQ